MILSDNAFRGARFALTFGTARPAIRWMATLLAAAAICAFVRADIFGRVVLLLFTVAGAGLARHSIGHDRISGRSLLYFQRPVTPRAHYAAQMILGAGLIAMLAAITAIIGLVAAWAGGSQYMWAHAAGGFYWGILLLVVGMSLSTIARRHDLDTLIVLIFLSFGQALIAEAFDVAVAREILSWLLLPIDPLFIAWDQWSKGTWDVNTQDLLQLVVYPLVWLALLWLRLRDEDIGAANYEAS